MDWVDNLKLGLVVIHYLFSQLKCLDFQCNQYRKLPPQCSHVSAIGYCICFLHLKARSNSKPLEPVMFILASHIYLSNVGFRFKLDRVFYLASHIYISNVGYRFKRDRVSFYFSYQGKTGKIAFGCFQFINNAHCFFFWVDKIVESTFLLGLNCQTTCEIIILSIFYVLVFTELK